MKEKQGPAGEGVPLCRCSSHNHPGHRQWRKSLSDHTPRDKQLYNGSKSKNKNPISQLMSNLKEGDAQAGAAEVVRVGSKGRTT